MTTGGPSTRPWPSVYSSSGLVASVDQLASSAGVQMLAAGGSAADAAIAANAVLAVTSPHLCGMGGDLFALVHHGNGAPAALAAAGRAGSGADAARMRAEGHREMPMRGDVRAATVPGCVDGWCALHERHGRLPFAAVLAPARRLAEDGFPAGPLLAFMLPTLAGVAGCDELTAGTPDTGDRIRRPDVARVLAELAEGGRESFYQGRFGAGLIEVGAGEYDAADLARSQADWVNPLALRVWGHDLWTVPPPSQGYLALAAARIAELAWERLARAGAAPSGDPDAPDAPDAPGPRPGNAADLPDPDDPAWPHLLVEASRLAGEDRPTQLHDAADGAALLAEGRLRRLADRFDPLATAGAWGPAQVGDTMYLCAVDAQGMGVSLIQSNAKDFGCQVAVPGTGILLHNRGTGFSLEAGNPAEYAPGRRPPHTLSPALVTRPDGSLRALLGTMGGDSQPQVVLQMAARLLVGGPEAGDVIQAPRFVLARPFGTGFDTWTELGGQVVRIEEHAPPSWAPGLVARGHRVEVAGFDPAGFGHAQLIEVRPDGIIAGAADPRAMTGAAVASV